MRRSIAVGMVLATLVLAGCGDDDDTTTPPATGGSSEGVVVVAEDIKFPEDTYDATAGTVNVTYRNDGAIPHTLLIEDVDDFKLEVAKKGDEDEGSVELAAGTYTIYCDIPGHRQAGMEAELEVK